MASMFKHRKAQKRKYVYERVTQFSMSFELATVQEDVSVGTGYDSLVL